MKQITEDGMIDQITPVEAVMVGLWSRDRLKTVDLLCGATAYAMSAGNLDDASTLSECALLALLMMKGEL